MREYELREIDSQARIRELEQTNEIMSDKLATLQRSENKLKYRVHELEGIGGQVGLCFAYLFIFGFFCYRQGELFSYF